MAVLLFFAPLAQAAVNTQQAPSGPSTADHHKFEQLKKKFTRGPKVTRACLSCHTEAAGQIQQTEHWTWESTQNAFEHTHKNIGKVRFLNNL